MNAPCFKHVLFGCLFAMVLGTWGCSSEFYLPNAVHMPLLEGKNDFDINSSIRFTDEVQFDLQTAYAPLDHFEVMLNGLSSKTSYREYKKEHKFLEAGAGVFHAFGDNNLNKELRAEFIGGYGLGLSNKMDFDYRSTGRFQRKFVQPGVGVKIKGFEAGFAMRFSEINFANYSIYQSGQLTEKDILDFTTLESCFRSAVGFRGFKFGAQLTYLKVLRGEEDFKRATGVVDGQGFIDFFFNFSPWRYKTPKGVNYRLNPDNTLGVPSMELMIYDSPCWVCLPKNALYKDLIQFTLNGINVDYSAKSSNMFCHRLQLRRNYKNLLSVAWKNAADTISTPVNVILIDGRVKRPFYIDLSGDKRMDFYLTY